MDKDKAQRLNQILWKAQLKASERLGGRPVHVLDNGMPFRTGTGKISGDRWEWCLVQRDRKRGEGEHVYARIVMPWMPNSEELDETVFAAKAEQAVVELCELIERLEADDG